MFKKERDQIRIEETDHGDAENFTGFYVYRNGEAIIRLTVYASKIALDRRNIDKPSNPNQWLPLASVDIEE